MEFFAGAFLQADGVAEADNHFSACYAFGVDDLRFPDEADSVAGNGDGGGFIGEERECRATLFHGFGCLVEQMAFSAIPRGDKGFPKPGKLFVQGRK